MSASEDRAFRIVVSYRRVDTGGDARALAEALSERFGEENVFFDLDAIAPGEPFDEAIGNAVAASDVFAALVGPHWLTVEGPDGGRRLDDPEDFVRRELETALAGDVRVIPVLLEEARMPAPEDLPPTLAAFSRRNAVELRASSWHPDVERFVGTLAQLRREKLRRAEGRQGAKARLLGFLRDGVDVAGYRIRRTPALALGAGVAVALVAVALALWLVGRDESPAASPAAAPTEGSALAYSSGGRIFLLAGDGAPVRLPGPGPRQGPDWSPDGTSLAFAQDGDIWTSDPDGSDAKRLTEGEEQDASPAWSPDGRRIAFDRPGEDGKGRLWVVDASGGDPVLLMDGVDETGVAPDWSPNGRRLVYQRQFQIWTMSADGSSQQSITAGTGRPALFPSWSPDGGRIAFAFVGDASAGCEIGVVRPNGADLLELPLSEPSRCRDPGWSHDGRRIVFAAGDEGIWQMARDGSDPTQIVDAPGAHDPSWAAPG